MVVGWSVLQLRVLGVLLEAFLKSLEKDLTSAARDCLMQESSLNDISTKSVKLMQMNVEGILYPQR